MKHKHHLKIGEDAVYHELPSHLAHLATLSRDIHSVEYFSSAHF